MQTKTLPLIDIKHDGDTQMRDELNLATVADYRNEIENGATFPPIVVFSDGSTYWLAAAQADQETIECEIREGTHRDAILYACGANGSHGLRRTSADKHRAVMKLLNDAEWAQWSDRAIAEKCCVSNTFVGSLRGQLSTVDSCSKRKGKDGKVRKAVKKRTKTHKPTEPTEANPAKPEPINTVATPTEPHHDYTCPFCGGHELASDDKGSYCAVCKDPGDVEPAAEQESPQDANTRILNEMVAKVDEIQDLIKKLSKDRLGHKTYQASIRRSLKSAKRGMQDWLKLPPRER